MGPRGELPQGERWREARTRISINALKRLYKYLYDEIDGVRAGERMMGREAGKAQGGWWGFFTKGGILHEARA